MASTLVRQWHMLSMLPRGPRRIDAATLAERLRAKGYDVHRRTIQRDLVELARLFPIVSDDRTKPYGWRWADGAEPLCVLPPPAVAGERFALRLRVRRGLVTKVTEGLRCGDGAERPSRDPEWVEIEAQVVDGCGLRRFLLGFADGVCVLGPPELRAAIAEAHARAAALHAP